MPASNPPVRGEAFRFDAAVNDMLNAGRIKTDPTLEAGDVKVYKDGGTGADIDTLPSESPTNSGLLDVQLTATEMDADRVTIRFRDQTEPPEWADQVYTILTTD